MTLSKKQQQTLVVAIMITVAGAYIYYSYLWKPMSAKITQLDADLATTNDKVSMLKRTAERLPALRAERDALLVEVGQTEKKLPRQKSLDNVLRIVTENALKFRVSVQSFSPGGERPDAYFVELPVTLTIAGQFHTVGRFLSALGLEERILSPRGLSLSAAANAKKNQTVSGTFTLLTYFSKG